MWTDSALTSTAVCVRTQPALHACHCANLSVFKGTRCVHSGQKSTIMRQTDATQSSQTRYSRQCENHHCGKLTERCENHCGKLTHHRENHHCGKLAQHCEIVIMVNWRNTVKIVIMVNWRNTVEINVLKWCSAMDSFHCGKMAQRHSESDHCFKLLQTHRENYRLQIAQHSENHHRGKLAQCSQNHHQS